MCAIPINLSTVINNQYQGNYPHVLCVCSAGCLRSPTAAEVLSKAPFYFNTRSAGAYKEFSLVPVTETLLEWAEQIVCMEEAHAEAIKILLEAYDIDTPVVVLDIPDIYSFRDPKLKKLIYKNYIKVTNFKRKNDVQN